MPKEVKFDYSDAISTANADVNPDIHRPSINTYNIGHTRDFYRGHSFRYAGVWTEGVHYLNDNYVTDFVSINNALLACTVSHLSSDENKPRDFTIDDQGNIVDVNSGYWTVVLLASAGAYLSVYGGLMEGNIDMQDHAITNVSDPVHNKDVTNKQYVGSAIDSKFILLSEEEFDELVDKDNTKIYLVYSDDSA